MHDQERAVYVISVAAELAGVHPQTLRIYERKGLLQPARTGGGSRRYSQDDIDLLCRIQDLTNEGLNLVGVARVLELEAELARTSDELQRIRDDAQRQLQQSHREAEEHRRSLRRDLVPLRQEVVLYRDHGPSGRPR